MKSLRLWVLPILLFLSFTTTAQTTKRQQNYALEALLSELETHYGMAPFKEKMFGVSIEGLREKYSRLIEDAKTLEEATGLDPATPREVLPAEEFRQLMIGMIAELRDGHVNVNRQTSQYSTLGINAATFGEKLYVSEIRKDLMLSNSSTQTMEVGDEIVALNGVPVAELAKRNMLYASGGTFSDRWQTAMLTIINTPHSLMRAKTEGEKATLTLRRGKLEYEAHFRWLEISEYLFMTQMFAKEFPARAKVYSEDRPIVYGMRGTVRSYFKSGVLALDQDTIIDIGEMLNADIRKAKAEDDGDKNLKKLNPVTRVSLYLVRHKDKNVAVFRLPSYSPGSGQDMKNEYLWIAAGLKRLEKLSDVAVLDFLSNTGGSVYYGARLLSLFATKDRPLKTLLANHKLNETYLSAIRPSFAKDTISGEPAVHADLKLYEQFYDELQAKFVSGQAWSGLVPTLELRTEALDNQAGEVFAAQEAVYTKDILLLNDKMSGSMGDMVPAVLQYNNRAKVFGETSCGLGGSVYRKIDSMPGSQLSMRCTTNYQELPNGWPVENIGVVPDFYRELKVSDLKDSFKKFAKEVLDRAVGMVSPQKPAPNETAPGKSVTQLAKLATQLREPGEYVSAAQALVAAAKSAKAEDWKDITLALPDPLLNDIILKTLFGRLEVIYRLQEMKALPEWQGESTLIQTALDLAVAVPESVPFAKPCELRLRMKALR